MVEIYLKQLVIQNLDPFYNWLVDDQVTKYSLSLFKRLNNKSSIEKWFVNLLLPNKELILGIFIKNTNELIGYAGICCLNKIGNVGEYFIFIGNKEYWGKGISTDVTKRIIEIGFSKMKLKEITLTVFEQNIAGVKSYLKAGFIETGIIKNARCIDGEFRNKIIMSIMK